MSRQRYQRGTLKPLCLPRRGNQSGSCPEVRTGLGGIAILNCRTARRRGALGKRSLRRNSRGISGSETEYEGPLNKADAQRVLDLLIAQDAGTYTPRDTAATFGQIAREYLATVEPGWGPHTVRTSKGLIEHALIGGKLGSRPVVELTEIELQQFLNEHVSSGASRSKLTKLLLYLRNILDHAVMKKIILANPARNPGYRLKAKSRKAVSERYLSMEECQRLLSAVVGADHLAFRILIQLGLRSEELFALRRNDVIEDMLRIDEAIVEGASAAVKTEASEASVYIPPDLQMEMRGWLECLGPEPRTWMFPSPKGRLWASQNY